MVKLLEVCDEHRKLLWNIHQKYLYEMTAYYNSEMDADGNYRYEYFDAYFTERARKALLIYDEQRLAGFAMINTHSYIGENPDYVLAEFTVFPMYRRRHIAAEAVRQIFNLLCGKWEIKYNEKNFAAKSLWNKITKAYNPKVWRVCDGETVLSFRTIKAP